MTGHPIFFDLVRPADLALAARTRVDLAAGRARIEREAAGVTAAEVAATLNVTRSAVWMWETGTRRPSAGHALAYGRLLASLTRAAA